MLNLRRLLRIPRMRKRRMIYLLLVIVVIYFVYQFGFISELSQQKKELKFKTSDYVPVSDFDKDSRDERQQSVPSKSHAEHEFRTSGSVFKCKASNKLISSDKVNDDYCDCPEDGADEFLTEACDNAVFYCKTSKIGFPSMIVSAWVNDGVCDCCDGSDEWQEKSILNLSYELQKKVQRFVSPCPKLC